MTIQKAELFGQQIIINNNHNSCQASGNEMDERLPTNKKG